MQGIVIFYNEAKKFGFIRTRGKALGADVFLHAAEIAAAGIPTPHLGELLEFDVVEHRPGKLQATNLRRVDGQSS